MIGVGTNFKLKLYLSKKIFVQLIPDNKLIGTLRGFDQFLNLVLDNCYLLDNFGKKYIGTVLLRGEMIISLGIY